MQLKHRASIRRIRIVSIRTQACDSKTSSDSFAAFYVTFSEQSGGIFVDAGIHIVSMPVSNDHSLH